MASFLLGVSILLLLLAAALFLYWRLYFLRNPERTIPRGDVVVSPADGKVIEIGEISLPGLGVKDAGRFNFSGDEIGKRALLISIFMSPLDVHYNRAPIRGRVEAVRYRKGSFHPANSPQSSENESNEIIIAGDRRTVGVVQVAGILARRIECFVKQGDIVEKGQRIGLINLGSRACLLLPIGAKARVSVGEQVYAGSTIIAELA